MTMFENDQPLLKRITRSPRTGLLSRILFDFYSLGPFSGEEFSEPSLNSSFVEGTITKGSVDNTSIMRRIITQFELRHRYSEYQQNLKS
ncbi:hypothetical protein TNCT_572591 [Trichonephila clavata]|uniref:Uncharacterized protein n=1 Tax=Trichonephila clavata TaxID=2740835 RepID=A0A8X6IXI4_TRICU|nr:hypothetical protein TNCT_572591 [Trichonephila clavata]